MAQDDPRPGRPAQLQPHEADHVLAHVEDGLAGRRAEDLHRLQLLDRTHRRAGRGDEPVLRRLGHDAHRGPAGVVEAGRAPAGLLEPRVVGLAHVEVGGEDRAGRRLPLLVGADRLDPAVGVLDPQLAQQAEALAVDVPPVPPREEAAVPAVAEQRADRVVAGAQLRGHVVGLVLEALAVARPARREELVAHAAAVDLELVQAVARHVRPGRADLAAQRERPAQHRRRLRLLQILAQHRLDPERLPVGGREQAGLEPCAGAPRRRRALAVPGADAPVVAVRGLERRAGVGDVDGLRGGHAAAVPQRAAGGERARVLRDLHLVGGLHRAAGVRPELPAQARSRRVDAERVLPVLAAQLRHLHRGGWRRSRSRRHRARATQHRGARQGKEGSRAENRVHEHLPCGPDPIRAETPCKAAGRSRPVLRGAVGGAHARFGPERR